MNSRKPLLGRDDNQRKSTILQQPSSATLINQQSRHNDVLRRFQTPTHRTDTPMKKQPIQQPMTRISRLDRPKASQTNSEEVVFTIAWSNEAQQKQHQSQQELHRQQIRHEQENDLDPQNLKSYLDQQQINELYSDSSEQSQTQQSENLPGAYIFDIQSQQVGSHRQTGRELPPFSCNETTVMDQTHSLLKRPHSEMTSPMQPTCDNQQGPPLHSIPSSPSLPTSSTVAISPHPPKRHHSLEFYSSPPHHDESQQYNERLPLSLFNFNTTSTKNHHLSPSKHYHTTELHLQVPTAIEYQQQQQQQQQQYRPLDALSESELFCQSPLTSSNDTYDEYQQPQSIDRYNTIRNYPPPSLHFADTLRTNQLKSLKSKTTMLTRTWAERWQSLLHDLSGPSQQTDLSSLLPPSELRRPPLSDFLLSRTSSDYLTIPHIVSHLPWSPVYNLNDDCLAEILKRCATTKTLCEASLVCKRWRHVALLPYVWRTIDYTWEMFVKQLLPLSSSRSGRRGRLSTSNNYNIDPFLSSPLMHIRTIILNNKKGSVSCLPERPMPSIFTNLCTLKISTMHYKDILDVITWTKHLKELNCSNILTLDSNNMVMITPFSELRQLRLLKLHFATMCELIGPNSLTSFAGGCTTNSRWLFSPTLRVLKIVNTYDMEEYLTPQWQQQQQQHQQHQQQEYENMTTAKMDQLVQSWNAMETTLMHKFRVFTALNRLTHLSLGYCTAYTARIWRECVAPVTKHLKALSLCGWNGDGHREAPLAWKERHDTAYMMNTPVDSYMEDVEKALAEMLGGLHCLNSLILIQFKCTKGVVSGMKQLQHNTGKSLSCKSLQATLANKDDASTFITRDMSDLDFTYSLSGYLDWHLLECKIELLDTSRLD